jgi:hypothetical protein
VGFIKLQMQRHTKTFLILVLKETLKVTLIAVRKEVTVSYLEINIQMYKDKRYELCFTSWTHFICKWANLVLSHNLFIDCTYPNKIEIIWIYFKTKLQKYHNENISNKFIHFYLNILLHKCNKCVYVYTNVHDMLTCVI